MMKKISDNLALDVKLQRYMDLSKFIHLLEASSVFFARISSFDDQLEGGLTPSYILQNTGWADTLDLVVNYMFPGMRPLSSEERIARDVVVNQKKKEISEMRFQTVFGNFDRTEEEVAKVCKAQRNWLDVSCWHKNMGESMAMWKIYGGATNSVCVETDVGALFESMTSFDGAVSKVKCNTLGETGFLRSV